MTSGPIVACDNAIEHYTKAVEQQIAETDKLRRKLAASIDAERIIEDTLKQWQDAKAALEIQARWDRIK